MYQAFQNNVKHRKLSLNKKQNHEIMMQDS